MINMAEVQQELQEARKTRIRTQAAGRYLEVMVERLYRSRQPWQWVHRTSPMAYLLQREWQDVRQLTCHSL